MGSIYLLVFICGRIYGFSVSCVPVVFVSRMFWLIIKTWLSYCFKVVLSTLLMLHVYVLVYVPDFAIVLFRSVVFEYILFCNRVVFATRVRFG